MRVIAVVLLDHAAVPDRDLLAQHVPKRVDDRAFGLRRDVARLHRYAGVDRGPEIVDLDLAARAVDRHLGDARRERVVLHHGADAERAALPLALPVGHLGDGAQERLHPRGAFRDGEAERDRVETAVRAYIKNQEMADQQLDQLQLKLASS
jgi:hypothetical protein